jgi:hypothetical protein
MKNEIDTSRQPETEKLEIKPAKTGLMVFILTLVLGLIVFVGFGQAAGVFAGKKIADAFTGSPAGWAALFGATLILGSPIIGATLWLMDVMVKKTIDEAMKNKTNLK